MNIGAIILLYMF